MWDSPRLAPQRPSHFCSRLKEYRDSERVRDTSSLTEAGLRALVRYPLLLLGVSWVDWLTEAQELAPSSAVLRLRPPTNPPAALQVEAFFLPSALLSSRYGA